MAKDLPYFKFYVSEWISGKITLEKYETQGLFINICALYWQRSGNLTFTEIKRRLSNGKPTAFESLLENGLIMVENDILTIKFLDDQMGDRKKLSEINRENGKLGGRPKSETKAIGFADKTNIEERRGEEKRGEEIDSTTHLNSNTHLTESNPQIAPMALEERLAAFRNSILSRGSKYSPEMLEAFITYWTEPTVDGHLMRFETEEKFSQSGRLATWAKKRPDGAVIAKDLTERRKEFADQLRPFVTLYGAKMMNDFYQYWGMPENKPEPKVLRYEREKFWDLKARVIMWAERNNSNQPKASTYVPTVPN